MAKGNHTPTIGSYQPFESGNLQHGGYRKPCYDLLEDGEKAIFDKIMKLKPTMIQIFTQDIYIMEVMENSLMKHIRDNPQDYAARESLERIRASKRNTGKVLARFEAIKSDEKISSKNMAALTKAIEQSGRLVEMKQKGILSTKTLTATELKAVEPIFPQTEELCGVDGCKMKAGYGTEHEGTGKCKYHENKQTD